MSAHPIIRRLCQKAGMAIVSTSANLSGQLPLRTALAVSRTFPVGLDGILEGAIGDSLQPSTITDLASGRIIR